MPTDQLHVLYGAVDTLNDTLKAPNSEWVRVSVKRDVLTSTRRALVWAADEIEQLRADIACREDELADDERAAERDADERDYRLDQ